MRSAPLSSRHCLSILVLLTLPTLPGPWADADTVTCALKLPPAGQGQHDRLGSAVSITGDTAFVGAPFDDDQGSSAGAVIVYVRTANDSWTQADKLTASDGTSNDYFGTSVSIDGDTALVGAYGAGGHSGNVYVFDRQDDGSWLETGTLGFNDPSDQFGYSVSLSGDLALIGAPGTDVEGNSAGVAWVFERQPDDTWHQADMLSGPKNPTNARFGTAVSISGDLALVSPNASSTVSLLPIIFERDTDGSWSLVAQLAPLDGSQYDHFGAAISLWGNTALVGARFHDHSDINSAGAVYVFEPDGSGDWPQVAKLTASNAAADDRFGSSVSLQADRALVGAPSMMDGLSPPGTVYCFQYDATGGWLETTAVVPVDGDPEEGFGSAVGLTQAGAIIGMPGDNDEGPLSGSAYIVPIYDGSIDQDCNRNGILDACEVLDGLAEDCNGNGVPDECDIPEGASEDCDDNGIPDECQDDDCNDNGIPDSCDIADGTSDDVDGNGIPDECPTPCPLLEQDLGYDGLDDEGIIRGSEIAMAGDIAAVMHFADDAYEIQFFHRENGLWQLEDTQGWLGTDGGVVFPRKALDISGDTVIAGVTSYDAGEVNIFRRQDGQWIQEALFEGGEDELLGLSVAISGDVAVIGKSNSYDGDGEAYVYRRYGNSWLHEATLVATLGEPTTWFGTEVAIDGDTIMVSGLASGPWVFEFDGQSWIETQQLDMEDMRLGTSVDIDGDFAIVGSLHNDPDNEAQVFRRARGTWEPMQSLESNDPETVSLGYAVRISGNLAVVTSGWNYDQWQAQGKIHVFQFNGKQWNEIEVFERPELPAGWLVSPRVALSGHQVAAGFIDGSVGTFSQVSLLTLPPSGNGSASDCNINGICDSLDIRSGGSRDCDGNGTPDECDIADGLYADIDGDGVPDGCEPDCNANAIPDDYELDQGQALDCNGNNVPDACDIASGQSPDENDDGVPDECDPDYVLRVATDGSAFFDTIQAALAVSSPGSTISVGPGIYHGPVSLPAHAVTLVSEDGPGVTTVRGGLGLTAMVIAAGQGLDTRVEGLAFAGADVPGQGGGLLVLGSTPTIVDCNFRDNIAVRGAGAAVMGGNRQPCVFMNCRFFRNTVTGPDQYAGGGGGLAVSNSLVLLRDTDFLGNESAFSGGGLAANQSLVLIEVCEFQYNTSPLPGAAIFNDTSVLRILESTFCNNEPTDILGEWSDLGGNVFSDDCDCPDTNGDGQVDVNDILAVLESWGDCPADDDCGGDVNFDGSVDVNDVLLVIGKWGTCD